MWSSATRHRRSSDMLQNLNLPYPSLSRPGKQQLPIYKRQRLVTIILIIFAVLLTIWALIRSFSPTSKELEVQPPYAGPYESLVDDGTLGFLPLKEAREICQRRRWEPYGTRNRRRKVYDLFLITTELDFFEIRLNELHDEVDYFVVLESATTFQMNPKPLYLKDKLAEFKQFEHKIIHRILDDTGAKKIPKDDTWEHERFTRNALFDQVILSLTGDQAPQQGDVLLVGDVDEIPRTGTLSALRNCAFPPRVTLRTQMYYYSYQWLHRGDLWHHPQATYYNGPKDTIRPESLRMDPPDAELYMAGWHCSSCFGTMREMKNKITSFSHKHYNQPYFLDTNRLLYRVRRGEDLFERPKELYDRVDDNLDVPEYLRTDENRKKFGYMLDRDPENANFQDL